MGFGGGHTLRYLSDTAAYACGIDVITECLTHAQALGVSADRLFDGANLPPELPQRIDFWLFQDSFEHIPHPAQFVEWVERNSSANTEVLIVLPEAASISETLLGSLWPHRLPDHTFHWSRRGLIEFWGRRNFHLVEAFSPRKYLSGATLIAHVQHKFGLAQRRVPPWPTMRFNIGEMGLHLRRSQRP
ncbi:MAG: hypothetical protein H0U13_15090 [Gemmatimonadaceae bacterium]|nr:hypothetical protein [Gemmatimonadaceae bacterium]